jgi:hypothetical protein
MLVLVDVVTVVGPAAPVAPVAPVAPFMPRITIKFFDALDVVNVYFLSDYEMLNTAAAICQDADCSKV